MISKINFWRTWPRSLQIALSLFSILCLALVCQTLYWYFNDLSNILQWDIATELNKKFIASEAFVEKGLRFTNNELIYYLKEWYLPSSPIFNQYASYLYLVALIFGLSLLSTGLSFQNSFWFLSLLITIAFFQISLRTEIVFQSTSNTAFLISFAAIGGVLFLFNSFLKNTGFWLRLISLLVLFSLLTFYAISYSKINQPVASLSSHGLLFGLVVFAVFLFLIAQEAIVVIVWAVSANSEKGKSSLLTFIGIGLLYLLNCLLIYLENIRLIDDSVMVVSPIILFLISAIIGVWGFKKQCEDIGFFSFQRTGLWIYLGLLMISMAFVGFSYATANDPLIELIDDYIAIAHFSIGLVFFAHIILNFIGVFQNGFNAYAVLYKPKFNSLVLTKILGVVVIGFFLIQKNIYSYNQLRAGLQNAIADFYLEEGENTAAETYYKESVAYDFYNHKANYALASMAKSVGDGVTAAYYYRQALQKSPSEFAYVGLTQNLETEDLFFDALFTSREALSKFPESNVLSTNTAHLLEKANARDSVYYYLDLAKNNCRSCQIENVNLQAFWIENALAEKLDTMSSPYAQNSYKSNLANQLAISRMTANVKNQLGETLQNNELNTTNFALLYNQFTLPENTLIVSDSIWNNILSNGANISFNEDLLYLKAIQGYQNGNKISAIKQLTYLAQDSSQTALMYRRKLGLWYLKEGLFNKAVYYFNAAGDNTSAEVLKENDFQNHLQLKQLQQAEEFLQMGINENTYLDIYKKAPFNPYLLKDISDYLVSQKRESEAYNMVFDALEFNDANITLWKKYVILALNNGVPDYAENGIQKLKQLLNPSDFSSFLNQVNEEKASIQTDKDEFK